MYSKAFLNYRTSKSIRHNRTERDSIGFAESRLIGILFTMDSEEKFNRIKMLQKDLEELGKKVEVLSFLPKGNTNFEFLFNIFTANDISFTGKFKNPDVLQFAQAKFDYLIVLDSNLSPIIRNVVAMSQAHCRMGCYVDNNHDLFEFMVSQNNQQDSLQLITEITKYLKGLNKESAYV